MGETGDIIKEFKDAKPPEKAVIIVAVGAVIGIALYWHSKHVATVQSQGVVGMGGATRGGSAQQSALPTIPQGQVPVLPQGVNPIYDQSGGVVAYGQGTSTPSAPTLPTYSLKTVRTRGLWPGQSFGSGGGVPIFNAPNVTFNQAGEPTNTIGGVPFLNDVQIGAATHGNYAGKDATYYPVTINGQQGYIGSWDLNAPPQAGAVGNPHGAPPTGIGYIRKSVRGGSMVTATYSRRGRQ